MGTGTTLKQAFDALMPQSKTEESSVSFDHIELTEDEIEAALTKAREEKYYKQKRIEYNQKLNQPFEVKVYSWQQMFEAFRAQYTIDNDNQALIENIAKYFAGETTTLNLNKGLLLMGGVGVGKTTLMHFFRFNQKYSYRIVSCRSVETEFSTRGDEMIRHYSNNHIPAHGSNPFNQGSLGYCFDDLGTEANGKHFGKDKNAMAEVILNRYDSGLDRSTTHVTTNLTAAELKEQYGSRVTDRMKEMMNVVTFPTTSKSRRA